MNKCICLGLTLVFCLMGSKSVSQSRLHGVVRDQQGKPVPFAGVGIVGLKKGTTANEDGAYVLENIPDGRQVFAVNALGFSPLRDTLEMTGDLEHMFQMKQSSMQLQEVLVSSTRIDENSGMAYSNVDKETISSINTVRDAPYVLEQLPGVVVNSDAGNGVGYTGLRVRGSDATRINVTINGVPVNDAESQGTFWVNMPDLISSAESIQLQRGVGASSNGAGAFGATINFQTMAVREKPYASLSNMAGSFNTFRHTLSAGTGLLNNRFSLDARASRVTSDGYIDRAASNLHSYYLAGGLYLGKSVIRFINFSGWERTYQAWYYVPQDSVRAGNRTYNSAGQYTDATGKLRYYDNETDNYNQNNSQLHFVHQFNSRAYLNITGHFTAGKGYYEQYKEDRFMQDYLIAPMITGKSDTITQTDLVRRLWLDNRFGGGIFNFGYRASSALSFVLGGGYNSYYGKHFGRVMWSRIASDSELDHEYYLNAANKNDGNLYLKTSFRPFSGFNVFVDLQARQVSYRFFGLNDSLEEGMQQVQYLFFNPKVGFNYDLNARLAVYASLAVANKEPNRDDFVQSTPGSRPKHEQLTDLEAGFRYRAARLQFALNLYDMEYRNQLVLNGEINNVGAYNRVNVERSYRRGLELEALFAITPKMSVSGNLTLSQNRILSFREFIDSTSADGSEFVQHRVEHNNTDISFSPGAVSALAFSYTVFKGFNVTLTHKYVGRQYLDNTSSVSRSINPYQYTDLRLSYTSSFFKGGAQYTLMLAVYNLFDAMYETNGYTINYYYGNRLYTDNYLAPAAPRNFAAGLTIGF